MTPGEIPTTIHPGTRLAQPLCGFAEIRDVGLLAAVRTLTQWSKRMHFGNLLPPKRGARGQSAESKTVIETEAASVGRLIPQQHRHPQPVAARLRHLRDASTDA
jgi:hypothetical protein